MRKFLRKCLLFKKQKVDPTGYYGIEDPFPDLISKLRRFMGGYGVPVVGCHTMQKVENTDVYWEVYSTRIIELYSHVYFSGIHICK